MLILVQIIQVVLILSNHHFFKELSLRVLQERIIEKIHMEGFVELVGNYFVFVENDTCFRNCLYKI